jgi:hypothetical protein
MNVDMLFTWFESDLKLINNLQMVKLHFDTGKNGKQTHMRSILGSTNRVDA